VKRALVLTMLLGLTACAPSLQSLISHRHYREAICATEGDAAQSEVAMVIGDDADLHFHLHRVTAAELRHVLQNATPVVLSRGDLVRLRVVSRGLPIDGYALTARLEDRRGAGEAELASWSSLVDLTGEILPDEHVEKTYATPKNFFLGLGTMLTLGVPLLFTGGSYFKPGYVNVAPGRSDYARVAPLATKLHDAIGFGGCEPRSATRGGQVHARCDAYFVVSNLDEGRWQLRIGQAFVADRIGVDPGASDDERVCRLAREDVIPLTDFTQGSAMRPLPPTR